MDIIANGVEEKENVSINTYKYILQCNTKK